MSREDEETQKRKEEVMARCTRTDNLEVHHKSRSGGNGLNNAQVLCELCHKTTPSYGDPGTSPPPFNEETKEQALREAGRRCECTSDRG